jgi:hypothetical protein
MWHFSSEFRRRLFRGSCTGIAELEMRLRKGSKPFCARIGAMDKTNTKKMILFQEIFHGRTDVVPRFWRSRDGAKAGYSPICSNEWKEDICKKPCRTCPNAAYVSLSATLILDHLRGKHILGMYPLLDGDVLIFIVSDLDNHDGGKDPLRDLLSLWEVCEVNDVPLYALRSKSGNGIHAYIFFVSPVPAWKARLVFFAILQEAKVIGDEVQLSSFDKLIPSQDTLNGMRFGNLIALPFQGLAAKQGHTLFLDPQTRFEKPFPDQWTVLQNITRWNEAGIDTLIQEWNLTRSETQKPRNGSGNPPGWATKALRGVAEGARDDTGIKLAGYFRRKALPDDVILALMNLWNERNQPPLEAHEIEKIVNSASRYHEYGDPQNGSTNRIGVSFAEGQGSN